MFDLYNINLKNLFLTGCEYYTYFSANDNPEVGARCFIKKKKKQVIIINNI
jgi:hypothetical protein